MNGEFEAKDDSMNMYLQKVKEFVAKFDKFSLIHILRSDNAQADSLARLASSAETPNARNIIWEKSSLILVSMSCYPQSTDQKHRWNFSSSASNKKSSQKMKVMLESYRRKQNVLNSMMEPSTKNYIHIHS